jgi:hypothetical protein
MFVLGMAFLLLLFRSLVVPLLTIVLNLLSVGAAYGLPGRSSEQRHPGGPPRPLEEWRTDHRGGSKGTEDGEGQAQVGVGTPHEQAHGNRAQRLASGRADPPNQGVPSC